MVGAIGADWYRDTTIIQSDIDGGLVDCSCLRPAAPITQAYVELEFTNFDGAASADEYSCRVATRISGVFNICRFDVKVAGKYIILLIQVSLICKARMGQLSGSALCWVFISIPE